MTIEEAKRILGMRADENPADCLPQLEAARDRIADLVRLAPNDVIAMRYQDGLMDFDRALAAVREAGKAAAVAAAEAQVMGVAAAPGSGLAAGQVSAAAAPAEEPPPVKVPEIQPPVEVPQVAVQIVEVPAVDMPPATMPAAEVPVMTAPTGASPAVEVPAVASPAVAMPAVVVPAEAVQIVKIPTAEVPAVAEPAAVVPAVTFSTVAAPAVAAPAAAMQIVGVPAVVPAAVVPAVAAPAITFSTVADPAAAVQIVAAPAAVVPAVAVPVVPAAEVPAVTIPAVSVPTVQVSQVAVPVVEVPAVVVLAVEVPAVPAVEVPAVVVPAVALPVFAVPAVEIPAAQESREHIPLGPVFIHTADNAAEAAAAPATAFLVTPAPPVVAAPTVSPVTPQAVAPTNFVAVVPQPVPAAEPEVMPEKPAKRGGCFVRLLVWTLLFVIGGAVGAFLYWKMEDDRALQRMQRMAFLERQGAIMLEHRRWADAKQSYDEIATLAEEANAAEHGYFPDAVRSITKKPIYENEGKEIAIRGWRSIEAGIQEENSQFTAYWTDEASAAFDSGRWDDAAQAAGKVLEKFPDNSEMRGLLAKVDGARRVEEERHQMSEVKKALDEQRLDDAEATLKIILQRNPQHEAAAALLADVTAAKEKQQADRTKAHELYEKAKVRDTGKYDAQASEWIREAFSLMPGDPDIAALHEKFASYTRTLRVPGDFKTLAEAVTAAHDRDRIRLGAGTWKEVLLIDKALDIQGAGSAETIIQCRAQDACAVTFGPSAKGARVSGVTFRHESFDPGLERYAVALLRGGEVEFVDCRFADGSGHGLEVIEGGKAVAARCRFEHNGWDGAAARGKGSRLEVRDSDVMANFEHGLDAWEGASAVFVGNRIENNSRNGIHVEAGTNPVTVDGNRARGNREFGIVLGEAGGGTAKGNTAQANLLGGIVVRAKAAKVAVTGNQATGNSGSGLILERGLAAKNYQDNHISGNQAPEVLSDMELTGHDVPLEKP